MRLRMEAVLADGSAAAAVSVNVCVSGGGSLLGASTGSLESYCSDLRPVANTRISPGIDDDYLIATIIPLEEGTLIVEGFRITYRDGLRTFTDHAGPTIEVNATG